MKGRGEDVKDVKQKINGFSPHVSAEWLSSYFLSSGMEKIETQRGWKSLPRHELQSEPLSCQAYIFPQFGNNIISSEGERQR